MSKPNLNDDARNWEMIFNDEFNGDSLNMNKWRHERIMPDFQGNKGQMSQHVTNTFGFDTDGNVKDGAYPHGKRHGVWYDKYLDKTLSIENGSLMMGAFASNDDDPTIKSSHHPYTHPRDGQTADWSKKIYTSWIDTYGMSWHDGTLRPARQDSPNFYFRYGFIEIGVNFEGMHTKALRQSGWLLPAVDPADPDKALVGGTYDDSAANGLECDIYEYEPSPGAEHLLLCKNIGANAKNIPPVDCRDFGIDITKGDHTIAVYWDDKSMVWYVDGIEVCRDDEAIVHVSMAVYLTREGNSGVNSGDGAKSDKPFLQNDPGLWGYNLGTESAEKINSDKTAIRYVRVFQNPEQKNNWIAPGWVNGEGVEPATTVVIPNEPVVVVESPIQEIMPTFDLTIENNTLVWNRTHKDNTYDIKFDKNEYVGSVKSTQWNIPVDAPEGTYYVTSTTTDGLFIDSNKVIYNRNDLPAKPAEVVSEPKRQPVVIDTTQLPVIGTSDSDDVNSLIEHILVSVDKLKTIIER